MKKWLIVLGVVVLLLGSGAFVVIHHITEQRKADRKASLAVAQRFLQDWPAKRYADMDALTAEHDEAGESFKKLEERLQATSVTVVPGSLSADGKHLPYAVTLALTGLGALGWTGEVQTTKTHSGWRVAFRSDTVYPGLQNGQVLRRSAPIAARGALTDRRGRPIRPASADLAANVLGSIEGTKSGLERLYDAQLTGSSGGRVEVIDRISGQVVSVVKAFPSKPARPVATTLDLDVQRAAEAALEGAAEPAALVVLDTATGEVRAVADRPVAGLPAAFRDEAPGSTFKVVVAAAALLHGYTPTSSVSCPATVTFGGKQFKNDEPEPATMTLAEAFAVSCNTAFLTIADSLPKGTLRQTSSMFGFNRGPLLPTGAQGGQVPVPESTSEAYADVIGQGRVEASPLLLASMSAAVASGVWHQPHLTGSAASLPLPRAIVAPLQQLMAGVVTHGTAASAGLPVGTRGKTGTAQYGSTPPLPTHAWFTGYRGNLAFCVYLQDGVSGGKSAAPIAARFLRAV